MHQMNPDLQTKHKQGGWVEFGETLNILLFWSLIDSCSFFSEKKANPKMSSSSDKTDTSNPRKQKPLPCPLGPSRDWQNLPELLFGNVMMMVGMDQHENIPKCRQVCQGWNVRVSQMTKLKKDTIRSTAESQATVIRDTGRLYFTRQVSLS